MLSVTKERRKHFISCLQKGIENRKKTGFDDELLMVYKLGVKTITDIRGNEDSIYSKCLEQTLQKIDERKISLKLLTQNPRNSLRNSFLPIRLNGRSLLEKCIKEKEKTILEKEKIIKGLKNLIRWVKIG